MWSKNIIRIALRVLYMIQPLSLARARRQEEGGKSTTRLLHYSSVWYFGEINYRKKYMLERDVEVVYSFDGSQVMFGWIFTTFNPSINILICAFFGSTISIVRTRRRWRESLSRPIHIDEWLLARYIELCVLLFGELLPRVEIIMIIIYVGWKISSRMPYNSNTASNQGKLEPVHTLDLRLFDFDGNRERENFH